MRPTVRFALHVSSAVALAAGLTALAAPLASASASAATASAQRETRTYAAGRFMLSIGDDHAFLDSSDGGAAAQHSIPIESWSWGAALLGHGAAIDPAFPVPKVLAPRDVASGQASGKRKGWDGSVKGGSIVESSGTAKFGAISGVRRDEAIAKPAARIAQPASPPPVDGSITVDGDFPGCAVGTKYANAVLQLGGVRYVMTDVQVTRCPAAGATLGGPRTEDSLSLNYRKVTVRAWNPETKEL